MNMGRPRTSRGLRQITEGLGALDAEVFEAVANSRSPLLDTTMPALTRAADHAKLWLAVAAAMATSGSRSARRGAGRGVVSLAATSLITNQLAKLCGSVSGRLSGQSLALSAFQFGELPVEPCSGITDLLLDVVNVVGLEAQPVDDVLRDVARMVGDPFRPTTT
jgi:hypothetical protein